MSLGEQFVPRSQEFGIDVVKNQLLMNLNFLSMEIQNFRLDRRFVRFFATDTFKFFARKKLNQEQAFFVQSINDRLDYLLEIAKNVLKHPNDPEQLEYKKFANYAEELIHQSLIRRKLFGLKSKKF